MVIRMLILRLLLYLLFSGIVSLLFYMVIQIRNNRRKKLQDKIRLEREKQLQIELETKRAEDELRKEEKQRERGFQKIVSRHRSC